MHLASLRILSRAVVALLFAAASVAARADHVWTHRSPAPTSERIASFAYGNGRFVGVGEDGQILTSPDGAAWTERESGVYSDLTRVRFDGTHFVAIGTETTTVNGQSQTSGFALRSTDGITWTKATVASPLRDLAFGNGVFVAIGTAPNTTARSTVLTSADGATWTSITATYELKRVQFAAGHFVAVDNTGHALVSTDGASWNSAVVFPGITADDAVAGFAASSTAFLVSFVQGKTFLSTDGTTWSDVSGVDHSTGTVLPAPNTDGSLGYASGYFYTLQHSSGYYIPYARIYRSADGRTWDVVTGQPPIDFDSAATGAGVSVASEVPLYPWSGASNPTVNVIHRSTDGLEWQSVTDVPVAPNTTLPVVYGLGRFYHNGSVSNDGVSWIALPEAIAATHAAGSRVFAVQPGTGSANATILVSSDGLTSTPTDIKIPRPTAVAFGHGVYVWVGYGGLISTSPNGSTWTARTSGTTQTLNAVVYASSQFVAVGDAGTLLVSSDAVTWSPVGAATLAPYNLKAVAASGSRIAIAATTADATNTGASLSLSDGTPVTVTPFPVVEWLAYFDGAFLTSYVNQTQWQSDGSTKSVLASSPDGVTWTTVPLHTSAIDSTRFAVGDGSGMLLARTRRQGPAGSLIFSQTLFQAIVTTSTSAPVVSLPPGDVSVPSGETTIFMAGTQGSPPLQYQWTKDGVPIAGANEPALRLTGVEAGDAGTYAVTITNGSGTVTSTGATLTSTPAVPLTITQQPADTEYANQTPAVLSVKVSGSGPITYQWRQNGWPVSGATDSSYSPFLYYPATDYIYDVVVTAPHSTVTSAKARVTWGGVAIQPTFQPSTSVPVGASVAITQSATAVHPPLTYRWTNPNGADVPGAVSPTLRLSNVTTADSGTYQFFATDALGNVAQSNYSVSVLPDGSKDIQITAQPTAPAAIAQGSSVTLTVGSTAPGWATYIWRRNGQPLSPPWGSGPSYTIPSFSPDTQGVYDVVIVWGGEAVVSQSVQVGGPASRLINLSARAMAGTGEDGLIEGFVVAGPPLSGGPNVIVRTVGPGLVNFGVPSALRDPAFHVVDSTAHLIAENDNWSTPITSGIGAPATAADMAARGAFALAAGSSDAAVELPGLAPGGYTALSNGGGGSTGVVLTEVYGVPNSSQRLVNLSARARVGSNDQVLIAGFVITGTAPLRVLLRGVGPSLARFNLQHPLANPTITLFNGDGHAIANNDKWGSAANAAEIRSLAAALGAFTLPDDSNDAALLVTLDPGVYTLQVSSFDGTSGVALAEIYEAP